MLLCEWNFIRTFTMFASVSLVFCLVSICFALPTTKIVNKVRKSVFALSWPFFAYNSTMLTPTDILTDIIKYFEFKHLWWPLFLLEVQKKMTFLFNRIKSPVWPWRGCCANFHSSTTESHMWSVLGRTLLCLGDRYNFYVTHLNLCKLSRYDVYGFRNGRVGKLLP